ncbi:hypothetical protein QQP08_023657 [Theobroma cacao]|nr:hypothetical protein QQP08_023657 [Theobroma cacao]
MFNPVVVRKRVGKRAGPSGLRFPISKSGLHTHTCSIQDMATHHFFSFLSYFRLKKFVSTLPIAKPLSYLISHMMVGFGRMTCLIVNFLDYLNRGRIGGKQVKTLSGLGAQTWSRL